MVSNHIHADQQQPALRQHWPQSLGNFPVARRQCLCHTLAASGQVAAYLTTLRDTRQAKRHRLATNQQHPLVALGYLRQELLHHDRQCALRVQGLDDDAQIQAVIAHAEDAGAAHAVQRLENDVAVLCVKTADIGRAACHQGRTTELCKLHDRQLFRMVTQCPRLVEYPRAFALGLLQQMRRIKVLGVERGVAAHQHRREIFQRAPRPLVRAMCCFEPARCVGVQSDISHSRLHRRATDPVQINRFASRQLVAPLLQFTHHRERGVLVNLE